MRRLRCVCCAVTRVKALCLTSACHAQGNNQINGLDGAVFPAGLARLGLVSLVLLVFDSWCVNVMFEADAVCMVCDDACCIVVSDVCMSCAGQKPNQPP